jgi:hypothetical protein
MSLAQYRRPKPTPKDSYVSTATETDIDAETFPESLDDETQQSNGVLEETLIQQTVGDDSHEF